MVADFNAPNVDPHRPRERAAAMTSSEGSDMTPRQVPLIRAEEEEQVLATPVSTSTATRDVNVGGSPNPASEVSGFGSVATDPENDS